MTEPSHAVFLSYASQDTEAAQRICEALRGAGIEVWFDQSELRGGDAWDRQIRQQIHECRLFIAVISAHTEARDEGYFRREWKLAVDRTHDMAEDKAFVVPVAIDGTNERSARVPDTFKHVQWTRFPGGETPPAFVERVRRLLAADASSAQAATARAGLTTAPITPTSLPYRWRSKLGLWVTAVVLAVVLAYIAVDKFSVLRHSPATPPATPTTQMPGTATAAAFTPPPHSIAVLPFTNLSGDPQQEYFSDGISEELINALSHIDALHVIARTSSFSFKGQNLDVGTIARKLNVGAILEGSIRRSGNTVRITAQLINTINGYHVWSEDYDRNLKDILALQTDIATAIASQLSAKLTGNEAQKIAAGGTDNPQAYDIYLLGVKLLLSADREQEDRAALDAFDRAIAIDPKFAAAYVRRANALIDIIVDTRDASIYQATCDQAARAAATAIALAPGFADGYAALAGVRITEADFRGAKPAIERALALNPGSARIQGAAAAFESRLGHHTEGIMAARRAVMLDPESYSARVTLMQSLLLAQRYSEGLQVAQEAAALNSSGPASRVIPFFYYYLGSAAQARELCESPSYAGRGTPEEHYCLALAYHALGDVSKAEIELQRYKDLGKDSEATGYASVYAQWGDAAQALDWLEKAEKLRDPALQALKVFPLLDPIRKQPRFKALERRLDFPP